MSEPVTARLRLTIDSRFEDVRLAGVAFQAVTEHAGYPKKSVRDMRLALVEALNNSVKHAYGMEPGHDIHIDLSLLPEDVEVLIRDTGKAAHNFKPKKLEFDPENVDTLPEGGMGLFLIHQLVDEMEYSSNQERNQLRIFKHMMPA